MLIGGEKWACDACVRGHRVSNCQHSDRPLTHINKKGRPVSQCTHCRSLRKSRSSHVKCDCGEKAHSKGACTHAKDGDSTADNCCCSHGGRCSCALKKEHLDPVPESDSDETSSSTPGTDSRRPRAFTVQSDVSLTKFNNGHHKPAIKHNKMAHQCGLPYVVPRAHTIHGPSPSGMANRSVDNLPHTNTIDALHSESHIKDSMVSAQQEQRKVKSEHNSPVLGASANLNLFGQLPPLNLSNLDGFNDNGDYGFPPLAFDGFNTIADNDQPIFSAGLSATSIDWSHYPGLEFNNDNFGTSPYSQPPSYSGFDFCSVDQPGLTTSTSGEISEAEDFGLNDSMQTRPSLISRKYGSDFETSDFGDTDGYRLSTNSSFMGLSQAQMLASNDLGNVDLDDFLKGVTTTDNYTSNNGTASILPLATYAEEQKNVQSGLPVEESFQVPMPETDNDTLWMDDFSSNPCLLEPTNDGLPNTGIWDQ